MDTAEDGVIVVGAGPSGMTVAALLAARGVPVTVLEARSGTSDEPKAISIDDEALRTYQQAGLAREILEIIIPGTGTQYYDAANRPLFQARAAVPYRLGYPFKNPFAQPDLERALADALLAHELVDLRYDTRVVGLTQDDALAHVIAEGPDGILRLSGRYVLGADGGRSVVREALGIGMTGRSYPDVWLVVDTLDDHRTERYGMHHGDPERPHVIVPGLNGRCRYEFRLFDGEGEAGVTPPFALIQRLVAPYRSIAPHQVERAVNYRFNAVNADRWRDGRCLLIGDAAHMMPPFAGQGLNSGIRDAANLAWKIAEVRAGAAPDALLDTYEAERKPHVSAVIRQSVRLGSIVMSTSPRVAAHRDRLVRQALATPEGRAYFEEMRYRPTAHYRGGLSLTEDAGYAIGQPLAFDPGTHRLHRLDALLGDGWSILGIDVTPAAWDEVREPARMFGATSRHVPLDDTEPRLPDPVGVLFDVDGGLVRECAPYQGRFVLVRPDRFIAAVWLPGQTAAITNAARAWRTALVAA
jgi:3-(3-hydroxy-phenyl)propionate hydroxylase